MNSYIFPARGELWISSTINGFWSFFDLFSPLFTPFQICFSSFVKIKTRVGISWGAWNVGVRSMDRQTDVDGMSLIDVSAEDDSLLSSPALKLSNDADRTPDFRSSPATTFRVQRNALSSTHHCTSSSGGYFRIVCRVSIFIDCSRCPRRKLLMNMWHYIELLLNTCIQKFSPCLPGFSTDTESLPRSFILLCVFRLQFLVSVQALRIIGF